MRESIICRAKGHLQSKGKIKKDLLKVFYLANPVIFVKSTTDALLGVLILSSDFAFLVQ